MASGPKLAETPLELLTNDGTRPHSVLYNVWGPFIGGAVGFVGIVLTNWALRKPIMSGLQQHVLATGIGAYLGKAADDYRNSVLAERDAVFRHYIELHPDDFPPFARKKYSEILESWYPTR